MSISLLSTKIWSAVTTLIRQLPRLKYNPVSDIHYIVKNISYVLRFLPAQKQDQDVYKRQVIPYEEALDIMRKGLAPLGEEYIEKMNKGLKEGWIDVYENKGKTSGAYSFGSYDSFPYILLNYTDTLKDVFTIVHEMGHSMHSRYTRDEQPYICLLYTSRCV